MGAGGTTLAIDGELVGAVVAALDGADPETCLEAALDVLRARGLANADVGGAAWLEVQRGTRHLALARHAEPGVEPPSEAIRGVLERLLGAALVRCEERAASLRVSERLAMLQAASFEGIIIHDEGVVVDCNERICEMFGYTREEMFDPAQLARGVAPADLEEARRRIRDRIEGEFVITCIRKDGSRLRAEFSTKQTRLGDRPIRVVALRDVTERERTAALLRESETRLQRLLEATFDCVMLSRDGKIVGANEGAERFFGQPRGELLGKRVVDLVAPAERPLVAGRIQSQTMGVHESVVLAAGGEAIPVMVATVPSTLNDEPVRVAALRDLREARRLEQERRQLELRFERAQRLESLGVLASGIAHDFNNLLVGILGSAEILLATVRDPDARALADTIRVAGERAAALTTQMLAYAGRRRLTTIEPVDLAELWRELSALLGAALSKKAEVKLELAPESVVLGERSTLMQVFMNLLTNASDALEDKAGRITVTTERVREPDAAWKLALGANVQAGNWVLVRVRDTGVGMDDATRARVFEPFFSTKAQGHGLGLGSCLGIVKAHGGAILVDSAPGQGSTFSLLLPATELRSRARVQTPVLVPPCRVLVVDDEPLVRTYVRRLLEERGFSVDEATGGSEGLEAILRAPPDVVLLDMMMPGLNGVEVVRRLRAMGRTIPVVICSGDLAATRERGLDPKAVQGFLAKPFSHDELVRAIDDARKHQSGSHGARRVGATEPEG